jgi:hypothetical protein
MMTAFPIAIDALTMSAILTRREQGFRREPAGCDRQREPGRQSEVGERARNARLAKATSEPAMEGLLDGSCCSKLQCAANRAASVGTGWDRRASAASVTKSHCRPKPLCESKGSGTCAACRLDCSYMDPSQWSIG